MPFATAARPSWLLFALVVVLATSCGTLGSGTGDEAVIRSQAISQQDRSDDGSSQITRDGAEGETEDEDGTATDTGSADGGGALDPAMGSSDPSPALSVDPSVSYPTDTCYRLPRGGRLAEEVPCEEPHEIEVYHSFDLPGGPGAPFQGREAAFPPCGAEFLSITGIGLNLATVFERSVLRPSEESWALGERDVTCYVVYPEPVEVRLADIDPLRSFGRVSVFGLAAGDCLTEFEETESWFEPIACDQPHEAEVFIAEVWPDTAFPGQAELDARADELCFGQPFEDFVGRDYASSSVFSLVSVPNAETWEQGDRLINCILTDDLVRSDSFEGSGL